jgi:hypothetical protein
VTDKPEPPDAVDQLVDQPIEVGQVLIEDPNTLEAGDVGESAADRPPPANDSLG